MEQVNHRTHTNSLCAKRRALCVNGSCSCAIRSTISGRSALTLVEMVMALAIMAIVFAAILPQFRAISNSWDSKQAGAESLQNGRVLTEHLYRNLAAAVRITTVSDSNETNGYITFEDNDGNTLRYDVNGTTSYVEFGVVGDLADLAGPVSQLQFTCYDACDFDTAITDCNYIRLVNVQTTLTNSASLAQDKTFTASAYVCANGNPATASGEATKMYWTDMAVFKIQRADPNGSNVEDLVSNVQNPMALVLDVSTGKMYWADRASANIQRADLDGSNVEELVSNIQKPTALVLDVAAGKMYWADDTSDKIQRADLDGSNVEDLVGNIQDPTALALDVDAGKMYWADSKADKLQRADLDGSNVEDLVSTVEDPMALVLDVVAGKMYWADLKADNIQRADLDGSNVEELVSNVKTPRALELDVIAGKIYWANENSQSIQRANLDGSSVEDLVSNVLIPRAMVLDIPAGKMYLADEGSQKLQRANLDGSNVEDLVTGLVIPDNVAMDGAILP